MFSEMPVLGIDICNTDMLQCLTNRRIYDQSNLHRPPTRGPARRLNAWAGAIDRSPAWLMRRILSDALAEYEETPAGYHIEVSAVADDGTEDDDV